jgi:hypothetical protein
MSSMWEMPTSLAAFCIPPDSSWKTPIVRPELSSVNVGASSSGIVSMSNFGSVERCTLATASAITVSVFGPRKSIFGSPSLPTAVDVELHGDVILLQRGRHELIERLIGDDDAGGVLAGVAVSTMPSRTRADSTIRLATGLAVDLQERSSALLVMALARRC